MRTWLIAVGRSKPGPERDLLRLYADRLDPALQVREVEEKRPLAVAERRAREASLLLDAVPKGAILVVLDERGRSLTSVAFAERIRDWRDQGAGDLAFLVGGADGHDETVRQRAALVLSLGPMTWPHMLVRGLLAEQIWRAQAILSGHPYHRA